VTDFRRHLDAVTAEITPQPWDYTTPDGTTLTVIPAGLRADPRQAEVVLRITASRTLAAEIGIPSAELPGLIDALTEHRAWDDASVLDGQITVTSPGGDGVLVVITETEWDGDDIPHETTASIRLPEAQRLPLASALRRALDVALGWED
jgi:hypothetical protein